MSNNASPEPPIKVAVVISNLTLGGAERQVVELSNHIDRRRFDLHVFLLSSHAPLAEQLEHADQRLHIIEKKNKFDITVVFRLARVLRRMNFDVVHGFLFDAEVASRLAGRLAGRKVLIGSERNTRNNFGRLKKAIYRSTSRLLDGCVANSNAGAAFNRTLTVLPETAYFVVHNGVDTHRFQPTDASKLRAELGFGDDVVVGMFGSFKHQKNHPMLLRAAARLLEKHQNLHFLFVGTTIHEGYAATDDYAGEVMQLVKDLDLGPHCSFVGAKTDIERYYNVCDVTALPSLFEGTPNVALESMACGVPMVATDVSDNSLVIPDAQAGFIVPLDDIEAFTHRLASLIDDAELRRALGEGARQWVTERFSLGRMADKMGEVYETLLSQQQPDRQRNASRLPADSR